MGFTATFYLFIYPLFNKEDYIKITLRYPNLFFQGDPVKTAAHRVSNNNKKQVQNSTQTK